jgi:hypothetical protein
MLCSIARKLDEPQLAEIQALERDLGLTIVAFACGKVDPSAKIAFARSWPSWGLS